MRWWTLLEPGLHLKEKHEPVTGSCVRVFTDDGSEMQIGRRDVEIDLLAGLAAGAGVRRFAFVNVNLAAARAPESAVRFLGAFEEEHFVVLVETIEKRGDFVGEFHPLTPRSGSSARCR
jgi:hypothetical protein